jgi:hypothetical protein
MDTVACLAVPSTVIFMRLLRFRFPPTRNLSPHLNPTAAPRSTLPLSLPLPQLPSSLLLLLLRPLLPSAGSASLAPAAHREDEEAQGMQARAPFPPLTKTDPPTSSNPELQTPGWRPSSRAHIAAQRLLQGARINLDDLLHLDGRGISKEWCGLHGSRVSRVEQCDL